MQILSRVLKLKSCQEQTFSYMVQIYSEAMQTFTWVMQHQALQKRTPSGTSHFA